MDCVGSTRRFVIGRAALASAGAIFAAAFALLAMPVMVASMLLAAASGASAVSATALVFATVMVVLAGVVRAAVVGACAVVAAAFVVETVVVVYAARGRIATILTADFLVVATALTLGADIVIRERQTKTVDTGGSEATLDSGFDRDAVVGRAASAFIGVDAVVTFGRWAAAERRRTKRNRAANIVNTAECTALDRSTVCDGATVTLDATIVAAHEPARTAIDTHVPVVAVLASIAAQLWCERVATQSFPGACRDLAVAAVRAVGVYAALVIRAFVVATDLIHAALELALTGIAVAIEAGSRSAEVIV